MKHSHDRLHTSIENSIDQIIVVIDSLFIDRSTRQDERQNAGPRNTETLVFHAHSRQALNILLIVKVILIGDIIFWIISWDYFLKERWRAPFKGNRAFNLSSAAGDHQK